MPKGLKLVQFNFTIKQHYLQLKGLGYYMLIEGILEVICAKFFHIYPFRVRHGLNCMAPLVSLSFSEENLIDYVTRMVFAVEPSKKLHLTNS